MYARKQKCPLYLYIQYPLPCASLDPSGAEMSEDVNKASPAVTQRSGSFHVCDVMQKNDGSVRDFG